MVRVGMPVYFTPISSTKPTATGQTQGTNAQQNNSCCCPSTTKFFQELATKLKEMTLSLKEQFSKLQAPMTSGLVLAEIKNEVEPAGIKMEYVYYIQRYGPPPGGKFDQTLLDLIRAEIRAGLITLV